MTAVTIEQHEGSHLPELEGGSWRRLTMTDDDGRRWVRFEWAPRADGEPG